MTFVRKDFYSTPPAPDATPEEWSTWSAADDLKARAAKAAYTKSLEHTETPEWLSADSVSKSTGGVHRQSTAVGFIGAEGDIRAERIDDAPLADSCAEHRAAIMRMEVTRHKRGVASKAKSARRRANRKARRIIG